jgi:hypothetical protein
VSTVLRQTDAQAALLRHNLAVVKIDGPSSIGVGSGVRYTAAIRNDGALADGNVEVTIGFAGVLQPEGGIVQSIGLSCGPGVVPATLMCRGGTLAPGQEASLAFSTHAANTGQGTITVSVRLSGNVTESDLDNNQASFNVTVTP